MSILDLGCGNRPEHWIPNSDGLDWQDFGQKYIWDLESLEPWPIEDSTYDKVVAKHILEHIKSPRAFIHILNEVWRVTKSGGAFVGECPRYDSPNYFRDPTHCRPISENTFDAFLEGSKIHFNDYGVVCGFRKRSISVNTNRDVCWVLEVVK